MISRTYVVQMPDGEGEASPLDILVLNDPGTVDDPALGASGGAYYELRGRPLRIPVLAAAGQANGFVPRLTLGFSIAVTPISTAAVAAFPGVQLSASLIDLASTDSGPTIAVPAFPDPAGQPAIRLTGSAGTAGLVFTVCLLVSEATDEDRSGTAKP